MDRILAINTETGEPLTVGSDDVVLSSAAHPAPYQKLLIEQVVFDGIEKPSMTLPQPFVALVINHDPTVTWKQDGTWRKHTFHPGQLSVHPAGDCGPYHSLDQSEVLIASLQLDHLSEIAPEMGLPPSVELRDEFTIVDDRFLPEVLLALRNEVSDRYPRGHLFTESLATAICAHLLSNYSTATGTATVEPVRAGLSKPVLKRVQDYVTDNFDRDLSTTDLARVAFMSPYHFTRTFKKSTGITPYRYVLTLRVKRACEMMRSGSDDFGQIARAVGFSDVSALSRQFKKQMGVSISAYLREIR